MATTKTLFSRLLDGSLDQLACAREAGIDKDQLNKYLLGKMVAPRAACEKLAAWGGETLPNVMKAMHRRVLDRIKNESTPHDGIR